MMFRMVVVLLSIFMFSCSSRQDSIIGEWKVNSRFYQAVYQIVEENDALSGVVLYYNDGTTKYKYDGLKRRYAFTGLKKDKDQYVDGITGATTKMEAPKSVEIKKRGRDTLEMTSYIMEKPLVEIWTRNKK